MDDFVPEQFPLTEGLNLFSPPSLLKAGYLSECSNFEIVSGEGGLKLVDGYEPFLGNSAPFSRLEWYYAQIDPTEVVTFDTPMGNAIKPVANWEAGLSSVGGPVYLDSIPRVLMGHFMGSFKQSDIDPTTSYLRYLPTDKSIGATSPLKVYTETSSFTKASRKLLAPVRVSSSTLNPDNFPFLPSISYASGNDISPTLVVSPPDSYSTKAVVAQKFVDHAKAYYKATGSFSSQLPQEALGLHWFESNLFAVAPIQAIYIAHFNAPPMAPDVKPGQYISFVVPAGGWNRRGSDGGIFTRIAATTVVRARVVGFKTASSGQPANTSYMLIEPIGFYPVTTTGAVDWPYYYTANVRNIMVPSSAAAGAVTLTQEDGTALSVLNFTIVTGAASWNALKNQIPSTVYQCLSEEDSLAKSTNDLTYTGWTPIPQTWTVEVEKAFSSSGQLVKIKTGIDPTAQTTTETAGQSAPQQGAGTNGNPTYVTTANSAFPQAVLYDHINVDHNDGVPNWRYLNSSSNSSWQTIRADGAYGGFLFNASYVDNAVTTADWVGMVAIRDVIIPAIGVDPTAIANFRSGALNFTGIKNLDNTTLNVGIPDTADIRGVTVVVTYDLPAYGDQFGYNIIDNVNHAGGELVLELNAGLSSVSPPTVLSSTLVPRTDALLGAVKTNVITTYVGTAQTATFGGAADMWGLTKITKEDVIRAVQGVTLQLSGRIKNVTGASREVILLRHMKITEVTVQVHYVLPSVRYYFHNGSNYVSGDLVDYTVRSGDLQAGDAKIVMQLNNVKRVAAGQRTNITLTDTVWSAASLAGQQVGAVTSDMTAVLLPSQKEIEDVQARYQFLDVNFYANTDQFIVYGVSGAGRAFSFDANYVSTIYANLDTDGADRDKPRHVAEYNGQLALGYKYGSVVFSDVGLPTSFTGLAGAAELATGQRVTGLLSLTGGDLGIFCDKSVKRLSGATPNYDLKTQSPNVGAIEYTVVDIGTPVYCSQAGITTLEQSDKYGDFYGSNMSEAVNSFLIPRLTTKAAANAPYSEESAQIIAAIPVRKKSQYKLFFEDGRVLTMTLAGPNKEPKFTFQKYHVQYPDTAIVPLAFSSGIDSTGRERVHISYRFDTDVAWQIDAEYGHVHKVYDVVELDAGWTFHFSPIFDAYAVISANYMNNPFEFGSLRKVRLEGKHQGFDNLLAYAYSSYEQYEPFNAAPNLQNMALFDESDPLIKEDYLPGSKMSNLLANGRFYKIALVANSRETYGATLTPSLGVLGQSINAQYEKGKPDA